MRGSHLESMAMDFAEIGWEGASVREKRARKRFALKALRVEVLRMLLGNMPFRRFSRTVASSDLLADFCGARQIDGIRGVSKSVLERASKLFTAEQVRWMKQVLIEMCGEKDRAKEIGLRAPVVTEICLAAALAAFAAYFLGSLNLFAFFGKDSACPVAGGRAGRDCAGLRRSGARGSICGAASAGLGQRVRLPRRLDFV